MEDEWVHSTHYWLAGLILHTHTNSSHHLHTQLGFLADHWLFFWHVIVDCPTSSKAGWHRNTRVSPCRNLEPSLIPNAGMPGSPQLPWSISERQNHNSRVRKCMYQCCRGLYFMWPPPLIFILLGIAFISRKLFLEAN